MKTTYNKNILLTVTGMSPAVVTETLYGLVVEKNVPITEIQVLTTERGKNKLLESLLGIVDGRKDKKINVIEQFIQDYGKQYGIEHIHFDENSITVIEDCNGNPLNDIRTLEENQFASDQIVQRVGELCRDEDSALHVSIAGGRKTMGFFVGYALSLFGRKQDTLSHVLVDETFENVREFYYPKPYSYFINNDKGQRIDAQNAKVVLAEIPWVRLGIGLPKKLCSQKLTYSEAVKKTQSWIDDKFSICFLNDPEDRIVLFNGVEIKLSAREYAFLYSIAYARKNNWDFALQDNYEKSVETFRKLVDFFGGKTDTINEYIKLYNKGNSSGITTLMSNLNGARTKIKEKLIDKCQISSDNAMKFLPFTDEKKNENNKFMFEPNLTIDTHQVEKVLDKILP